MQKAGITVASGWYGKGFSRQGKQGGRSHGYSGVEVSSAAHENNNTFSAYLQEGQSLEVQQHGKIQLNG